MLLKLLAFFVPIKSLLWKLSNSQEKEAITVEAKVKGQGSGATLPPFLRPG